MCDSTIDNLTQFKDRCSGYVTASNVSDLIDKHIPEFFIYGINTPTDEQWQMQNAIHGLCKSDQGFVCSEKLKEKCSKYTYNDLQNSVISGFCSCYLPETEYTQINEGTPIECFESCKHHNSVPLYLSTDRSEPIKCAQATCVIDNVSIAIKGGQSGNVSFNQVCPSCQVGACPCVVNDINLMSSDMGDMNLGQNCGNSSVCYSRNPDGTRESVPCHTAFSGTTLTQNEFDAKNDRNSFMLWIMIVALIIALLILIIK